MKKKRIDAYTLTELLVVLVIIGILILFAGGAGHHWDSDSVGIAETDAVGYPGPRPGSQKCTENGADLGENLFLRILKIHPGLGDHRF